MTHEFIRISEAKKKKDEMPDWITSSPEQIAEQALDLAKGKKDKAISILQKEYSRYVMKAWAYMSRDDTEAANLYSGVAQKILQARNATSLKG
jgi:hypothetical protein